MYDHQLVGNLSHLARTARTSTLHFGPVEINMYALLAVSFLSYTTTQQRKLSCIDRHSSSLHALDTRCAANRAYKRDKCDETFIMGQEIEVGMNAERAVEPLD